MDDYRRRLNSSQTSAPSTPSNIMTANSSASASANMSHDSSASFRRVASAVFFFCGSSLGAIFVNKACLTHFNFNYPSTLMVLQGLLTIVLLNVVSRLRPSLVSIVPVKSADYRRMIPSSLFFVSNVTIGLSALSRVNIPMFSAFRRLTVLFVMGAEYFMLHRTHSKSVVLSVVVLTAGAFVSALGDVTFSLTGYTLVFINNALTAAYLASIKRVMRDLSLDPISLLYYTSVISFPVILVIAVLTNDIQSAYIRFMTDEKLKESTFFLPALACVAVSAFCVNLSTSICTHVTSPLTTSVAGQVKNVLQSVLGFFSWGYVPTPLNVIGLLVALGGQVSFAVFKYRDSHSHKPSNSTDSIPQVSEPLNSVQSEESSTNRQSPNPSPSPPQWFRSALLRSSFNYSHRYFDWYSRQWQFVAFPRATDTICRCYFIQICF